ncbi:MAG: CARDB domain-containing protein [Pseudomonadota bacterium]
MSVNLQITSATFDDPNIPYYRYGEYLEFDFSVFNAGTSSHTENIYTGFYISNDPTLDPTDVFVSSRYNSTNISAGNTVAQSSGFNLSSDYFNGDGQYYLIFEADYRERVDESDETDNTFALALNISNTPSDYADVAVSNLSMSTTVFDGTEENVTVTFDWVNNFAQDAGEVEFDVYWSPDSYLSDEDLEIGDIDIMVGPSASGTASVDVDMTDIYSWAYGDGYFFVIADTDDEFFEGNNLSNGVAGTVGTAEPGSTSYGAHVGWYYEIVKTDYEVSTWDYGWYNGGHYAWGTYNGWHYGWYSVPGGWTFGWNMGWFNNGAGWQMGWNLGWYVAPASWALGWSVGWYMGWGWNASGWSVGWHLDTETYAYFSLGELKLATQDNPYLGWGTTDLGFGIGLALNPQAAGGSHYFDYNGDHEFYQIVLDSTGYSWGWSNGSMGWVASATFSLLSEAADGYYFVGWNEQWYSPLDSWDGMQRAWGLTWGWSGFEPGDYLYF